MPSLQQHPDYHQGFYDAQDGEPLRADPTAEYTEGWFAFHECMALLFTGTRGTVRTEYEAWKT